MISGLLGTPQGYIGHGTVLPIHRLAQQPFCVVRFLGLGTCHPVARTVVAQAIRDGYLTDGTGRRVFLSSAILVFEVPGARAARRQLGFIAGSAAVLEGPAPLGLPSAGSLERAIALLGEELGGECDLVLSPPAGPSRAGAAVIGRVLRELAERYRVAGVELTWDQAVEAWLGAQAGRLGQQRARERFVEEQVGRAVQAGRRGKSTAAKVSLAVGDTGVEVHS
jgi:hypothetical protein